MTSRLSRIENSQEIVILKDQGSEEGFKIDHDSPRTLQPGKVMVGGGGGVK